MISRRREDLPSGVGVLDEISSLLLKILRSPPPPVPFSDHVLELTSVISSSSRTLPSSQLTPAGFAFLLLGISFALMLCGSVAFFLGFILMPWILVLAMVFYLVGVVSSLSMLGRSLLCCFTAPTPRKDFNANFWTGIFSFDNQKIGNTHHHYVLGGTHTSLKSGPDRQ